MQVVFYLPFLLYVKLHKNAAYFFTVNFLLPVDSLV